MAARHCRNRVQEQAATRAARRSLLGMEVWRPLQDEVRVTLAEVGKTT
jgi:hypothetical protein